MKDIPSLSIDISNLSVVLEQALIIIIINKPDIAGS